MSAPIAGDLVVGIVAQRGRRGWGWGSKTHRAVVDHRYGPWGDRIWVRALCGRVGRLESGSDRPEDQCKVCERAAQRRA